MRRIPFSNRKPERQLFAQMAGGDTKENILLIEGPPELGKTQLLQQFRHDCPTGTRCVVADLKAAQAGPSDVFWCLISALGRDCFPSFTEETARLLDLSSVRVNVEHNFVVGKLDVNMVLRTDDSMRELRLARLQSALFNDLRAFKQRIVILLDTYEAAGATVKDWVCQRLLSEAARIDGLLVVVAGRCVPIPTIEWNESHARRNLEELTDPDEWLACAQAAGLPFNREEIEFLCWGFKGNPRQIVTVFERRAREREMQM